MFYNVRNYRLFVTGIETTINNRFRIVVLLAAVLLAAGCAATEETSDTTVPAQADLPAPDRSLWNSVHNPDLALDYFVRGSILEDNGDFESAKKAFEQAVLYDNDASIFAALARANVHTGNAHHAAVYAREAVNRAPGKLDYRRQLAQLYILLGENDSAAAQFLTILEQDPSDTQTRYSLAQMYDQRDPEAAIQLYEGLKERMGDDWNVSTRLAELYSKHDRLDDAAGELETLLRLDPENVVVMQTLGSLSIQLRNFNRALDMYEALAERDPRNVSYRLGMAEIYLHRNNWDAASQSMRMALELEGITTEDAMRIGEIYFQQAVSDSRRTGEALDAIGLLKRKYPHEWKPLWYLGALMFNGGSYQPAVKHLNHALRLNPGNVQTLDVLARTYMTMGSFEDAIPTLRSIIGRNSATSTTYLQLGYCYSRVGRLDDAERALQQSVHLDPTGLQAITQLADLYASRKEYAKADDLYDATIETIEDGNLQRSEAYYVMLNNYAYTLAERGVRLDRALELARQAVTKDPGNSSFLDTIGWVHFKKENYNEARIYLEKAIAVTEEQGQKPGPVLFHHLGDVYLDLGETEKARSLWEQALEQDPGNTDLLRKLERDPQ